LLNLTFGLILAWNLLNPERQKHTIAAAARFWQPWWSV
jgi:hypothetical protein